MILSMSRHGLTYNINVRSDPATVRQIEQVAQRKERTTSWVVRDAIHMYLRIHNDA